MAEEVPVNPRHQDYISQARTYGKQLWDAINGLKAMQREWHALDYLNTLQDGQGMNKGYNKAEIGAIIFAVPDAIEPVLAAGHATNLAKIL